MFYKGTTLKIITRKELSYPWLKDCYDLCNKKGIDCLGFTITKLKLEPRLSEINCTLMASIDETIHGTNESSWAKQYLSGRKRKSCKSNGQDIDTSKLDK